MDIPRDPVLEGLSITDRAYAALSGIAMGWLENYRGFRCACLLCGIRIDRPREDCPRNLVVYETILAFLVEIGRLKCEHWGKYQDMRNDPEYSSSEDMINVLALLKRGRVSHGRPRKVPCQES